MSDQELIERLRDGCNLQQRDGERAADRIEELVKERDDLGRKLNTARYGQPDFAWSIHEEAMADLRAKLAKAVQALRKIADYTHIGESGQGVKQHAEARIASAALAELEGK